MYTTISRCVGSLLTILILGAVVDATDPDHPVPNPKSGITAWGKPANGLQAGIRCPEKRQTIAPGEVVDLEIVIRNVSDEPIKFTYLRPQYRAARKKGAVALTAGYEGNGCPDEVHIHPSKEMLLGEISIGDIRPKNPIAACAWRLELPPGKYQVGSDNVVVPVKGDQIDWKLGTGYLDLELVEKR